MLGFTTLLLYLNDSMSGGMTHFTRYVNADTMTDTKEGLNVEPEVGNAVLFYSQLLNENMNDFSHHAAMPDRKDKNCVYMCVVMDECLIHYYYFSTFYSCPVLLSLLWEHLFFNM